MLKTQWRNRTSCCKFWWLDNSRSQGPKRQLRISKQSSICSRGAGSSHSMDPGVSVQKQNFTRNPEKLAKVPWSPEFQVIYTDTSLEFGKACEDLSWNHCTSTPHRSETNGIAERAVRRVKEGTSAVLLQSGLNESWWADSMECYTYLRNVTDLLSDGKTPCERRFGQPSKGPIIPFGSLVEYHPITAKDQSRIHQFGKKVLPGFFLGYALYAGWIWKGDVLIADLEELETMDASEIYSKRLNAKEVIFPKQGEFIFSNRRWTNQNPWRWSGTENIHLGAAATNSRRGSRWLSWRIRRVSSTTSRLTSGCRWRHKRFLVHVGKLHIPPSRWTQSQTLLSERRIIPYSTEIHRRNQNYSYEFGCNAREAHWSLLEHWWLSRLVWSLDRFHTTYSTQRKSSWRIYVVRGWDWRENSSHPDQIIYDQSNGSQWESMPSWRKSKSGLTKSSTLKTHENCVGSISSTPRIRNSKKPSRTRVRSWKHQ